MKLPHSFMALPVLAATALMLFPPLVHAQADRGSRVERSNNGHRGEGNRGNGNGNGPGNRGNDNGNRGNGPGNRGNDNGNRGNGPGDRGNRDDHRAERPRDNQPGDRNPGRGHDDRNPGRGNGHGDRIPGRGHGERDDHRAERPRDNRPGDRNPGRGHGPRAEPPRSDRPRDDRHHAERPRDHYQRPTQRRPGNYERRDGNRYYHRESRPTASREAYSRHYAQRWYHGTSYNYGPRHTPWVVGIRPASRAGGRYHLVTRNVWVPSYSERVWIDEECFTESDGYVYCDPGYWEVMTFGGFYEPQNHWVWQPFRRSAHVRY